MCGGLYLFLPLNHFCYWLQFNMFITILYRIFAFLILLVILLCNRGLTGLLGPYQETCLGLFWTYPEMPYPLNHDRSLDRRLYRLKREFQTRFFLFEFSSVANKVHSRCSLKGYGGCEMCFALSPLMILFRTKN